MRMSKHACQRSVQRGIPEGVVAAIYSYGTPSHSRGALSLRLDGNALELAYDELPERFCHKLERYRGTYIIADGSSVITVARPNRRRHN